MTSDESEPLLPGEELVEQGLADLIPHRVTDCPLLVLIAAPRLERLGVEIPERDFPRPYEHQLCDRLAERLGHGAHSHYNSLLRRIASYARALEGEQTRAELAAWRT